VSDTLFEVRDQIGYITLNRPAALNALTFDMLKAMRAQMEAWARDADVRAVIARGAGEKAFCAGGDVRAIRENFLAGNTVNAEFFAFEYAFDHYLHHYPKPYIALLHGIVMGGGMGIAQGAQLRIVTDSTRMAMPETAIGLFPDVGASYFLSRLPGALGPYLGISGAQIRAADALYAGLADLYVPAAQFEQLEVALQARQNSSALDFDVLGALRALGTATLPDAPLARLRPAIDEHFSAQSLPAIVKSLGAETRAELQTWAHETLAALGKRSPLAMSVTLEQLRRGKTLSLAECFRMELSLIHRTFECGDFMEGVRALLAKEHARWQHARIEDVTASALEAAFSPAWNVYSHPLASLI
jgi:enoyl-CoA hydratase/carnithine racemase